MKNTKVMLITGTRKGIGQYLARHYSKNGYQVIGCSRSESGDCVKNYQHFCLDVADEKKVLKLFAYIRKEFGRLDILINNAGIASMNHIMLTPVKRINEIFSTNVTGTFLFCREAAKIMQKNTFGRIVNFTTVAVPLKLEGEAPYAASKAAVVTLTQILAKELAQFQITVNAIGPGPVKTDLISAVPQEKIQNLINQQAVKRLGELKDISNVIDFYIRPESDFVTGQVIFLGGVC